MDCAPHRTYPARGDRGCRVNDLFPSHGIRIDAGYPFGECVAIRFGRHVYLFRADVEEDAPLAQLAYRVIYERRTKGDPKREESAMQSHAIAFDDERDACEFMRCWRAAARESTHKPLRESRCSRVDAFIPV